MTLAVMMLTAVTAWADGTLSGNGTEGSPYLINSAADWETFVNFCDVSEDNHKGKFFKLNSDITIEGNWSLAKDTKAFDRMIVKRFKGTFDGGGHTLTFNYVNLVLALAAPFEIISGATIKNLKIEGSIVVGKEFAGGIAGYAEGNNTIENCTSSVTISSNRTESRNNGGFIGWNQGSLTFRNCVFNGRIAGAGYTSSNSGFVGLNHYRAYADFTDCLSKPASVTACGCFNPFYISKGGDSFMRSCYYIITDGSYRFDKLQGKRIYTEAPDSIFTNKVTAADNNQYWATGTAEIDGLSSLYDLSAGVNLDYKVKCDGETLRSGTDYTAQILDNSGNAVTNITATGDYTLKVTGTGQLYAGSVSWPFEVFTQDAIPYIQISENGYKNKLNHTAERYTASNTPKGDWWYICDETTIDWRIEIKGEKHLILCDGATLNLPKGILLESGNTLYIYGQSKGTGKLIINGVDNYKAGIDGNDNGACGKLVLYGVEIDVTGGSGGAAGIGGGTSGAGGDITIIGAKVTANGGIGGGSTPYPNQQGGYGGTICIFSGIVQTNGMGGGNNNPSGSIKIELVEATDRVKSDGYRTQCLTLNADRMSLEDGTASTLDNIGGRTISLKLEVRFDGDGANGTMASVVRGCGTEYELPACDFTRDGYNFVCWEIGETPYQPGSKVTLDKDIEENGSGRFIQVKAIWESQDKMVTFDANGHGTAPALQIARVGDLVCEPDALTASEYVFCGWYTERDGGTKWDFANTPISENMTLYAKWEQHVNAIKYDLDGGTNSVDNPLYYNTNGSPITLSAPTKEGYRFTGWTGSNGETPQTEVTVTTTEGEKSYKAHWTLNQYTITFDTDGGTVFEPITLDYGSVITAPANPTKQGNIFMYWDGLPYLMPAENITVSARWCNLVKYEAEDPGCGQEGCLELIAVEGDILQHDARGAVDVEVEAVVASEIGVADDIQLATVGHDDVLGQPL